MFWNLYFLGFLQTNTYCTLNKYDLVESQNSFFYFCSSTERNWSIAGHQNDWSRWTFEHPPFNTHKLWGFTYTVAIDQITGLHCAHFLHLLCYVVTYRQNVFVLWSAQGNGRINFCSKDKFYYNTYELCCKIFSCCFRHNSSFERCIHFWIIPLTRVKLAYYCRLSSWKNLCNKSFLQSSPLKLASAQKPHLVEWILFFRILRWRIVSSSTLSKLLSFKISFIIQMQTSHTSIIGKLFEAFPMLAKLLCTKVKFFEEKEDDNHAPPTA